MLRTEQTILKEIEVLRRRLVQIVDNKGYTDSQTIQISQELDYVLNDYDYLQEVKLQQKS